MIFEKVTIFGLQGTQEKLKTFSSLRRYKTVDNFIFDRETTRPSIRSKVYKKHLDDSEFCTFVERYRKYSGMWFYQILQFQIKVS